MKHFSFYSSDVGKEGDVIVYLRNGLDGRRNADCGVSNAYFFSASGTCKKKKTDGAKIQAVNGKTHTFLNN